jgi:glycosyltransferase involved in cell wall biosynthesis
MAKITFLFRSPIPFTKELLRGPLGGAETAVIRIGDALRQLGIRVAMANRYSVSSLRGDVAVVVRFPVDLLRIREQFRRVYFWPPDDMSHGSLSPLNLPTFLARFNSALDGVLAISGYQQTRLIGAGIIPSKIIPTRYGVDLGLYPYRATLPEKICIYTSAPDRGLDELVHIWPAVVAVVPEARLWVFSSMRTYRGSDSRFQSLYEDLRAQPNVSVFDPVPQSELASYLLQSRVFLYPNTYPETASIATLEARAAGCVIVTPYRAALAETAQGNLIVPPYPVRLFRQALVERTIVALTNDDLYRTISRHNQISSSENDWSTIANEWAAQLDLLLS